MDRSQFEIKNKCIRAIRLLAEPEAEQFALQPGDTATVVCSFKSAPLTVVVHDDEEFGPLLTLWPGDGRITLKLNDSLVFEQ